MQYYGEAYKLRAAVNSLRGHKWQGGVLLKLNRLKQRLDTALAPMDEAMRTRATNGQVDVAYVNELAQDALDEAPQLPGTPIVTLKTIEQLPEGVVNGDEIELLQHWGVVESDRNDNGVGTEGEALEAVKQA